MSFLVILLVLLVDKFSDWRPRLQHDGPWLTRLRQAEANPRLRDAPWLTLLLLVVFLAVNASVLVLRRDRADHRHFRVPVFLPIGGIVSCLLLMTQVEGEVWRRGLPFLAVALVLAGIAVWRRRANRQNSAVATDN